MTYNAEIIAVGTELLLGNIANTDAQMISASLSELGINVFYHTVVGDNPARLRDAVAIARNRADIIITTGGLGPTYDDLTKQTVAECFDLELEEHPEVVHELREYFKKHLPHSPMPENNLQQAMLPVGCTVLKNNCGTAPGCAFEKDGKVVIMLPGPPRECESMFHLAAMPYLRKFSDAVIVSSNVMIFGMGESAVEEKLRTMMTENENPTVAPYVANGVVRLRVTAKAESEEAAKEMLSPVVAEIKETLGAHVFGVDVETLEQAVVEELRKQGVTLSSAESCTGGLFSKRITDIPGSSEIFLGGVVSYANSAKTDILGVRAEDIEKYGAVSKQVAVQMAQGARRVLGSDIAVGITGIAGPGGGTGEKSVGTVYIALDTKKGTYCRLINGGDTRERVRLMSSNHALDMVRRYLTGLEVEGKAGI